MPYQKLRFKPGFNKEGSNYSNEGAWYDGDKFRFRNGRPENIGGYKALTQDKFEGVCRRMFNFNLLNRTDVMFVGTNEAIYLEESSTFNEITPVIKTTRLPTALSGNSLLSLTVGDVYVGINDFPAEPKGVYAKMSVGTLEAVSTEKNTGFGQEANVSVGTVTVTTAPVSVSIAGSTTDVNVSTYNARLTIAAGNVTVVTQRDSVSGPIT